MDEYADIDHAAGAGYKFKTCGGPLPKDAPDEGREWSGAIVVACIVAVFVLLGFGVLYALVGM